MPWVIGVASWQWQLAVAVGRLAVGGKANDCFMFRNTANATELHLKGVQASKGSFQRAVVIAVGSWQ